MTAADLIYGVTMQEPGVSKLVSVRLGGEDSNPNRTRERALDRTQDRRLATA
jgi:chromosome segregation protein